MGFGEIAALGCAVIWASAIIFFKRAGSAVPSFHLNLFKNTLGSLCFLVTMLLVRDGGIFDLPYTAVEWGWLALSGIVGISMADAMLLRCLDLIGAGRMAVVDCLYTPFMVLSAVLILGEALYWSYLLGGVLVVAAVLIAGFERGEEIDRPRLVKGVWLGAGSMLLMSVSIVGVRHLMIEADVLPFIAIRLWISVAASLLWLGLRGRLKELRLFTRRDLPWWDLILGSFLGAFVGMGLWVLGFVYSPDETAVAAILNQTSVLFIIILAMIFLGERLTLRKSIGGLLGFCGIAVMIFVKT